MKHHLKIDSVFLKFKDKEILRGGYLEITNGEVVGILGRNGCGKSCFLKILIGHLQPQFCHIALNGLKVENLYSTKITINYLPQHEFHPKHLKVRDLVYYYDIDKVNFYNNYPFLKDFKDREFALLSGGMKRILEVLLLIESPAKFTILDEPFAHIMPIYVELVKEAIQRVKQRKGIIITDHQYRHILELSDKLHLLKEGIFHQIANKSELVEKGYISYNSI